MERDGDFVLCNAESLAEILRWRDRGKKVRLDQVLYILKGIFQSRSITSYSEYYCRSVGCRAVGHSPGAQGTGYRYWYDDIPNAFDVVSPV